MSKEKELKEGHRNPIINIIKTEWGCLGSRRKIFIAFILLFTIAGIINLMTPLVIGLIFNSIQQSITSGIEFRKIFFLISLLLFIEIGYLIFEGTARFLEERTSFFVYNNFCTNIRNN